MKRRCGPMAPAVALILALGWAPLQAQETPKPADPAHVFRAGAATSNITPPLGEPIVGNFNIPMAEQVHDELHARCLVLDDGKTRIAFAICDNVGIPREVFDAARAMLKDKTDLPVDNILMAATHSHSATSARSANSVNPDPELFAYQKFLAHRIADGIRRAEKNLEPARIGWGSVNVPDQLNNRRWYLKDPALMRNPFGGVDKVRMNPPRGSDVLDRPAGPTDPQVSFLTVQAKDGRPIALLANYSLHYVGGVPKGVVSADYFAVFADKVQQKLGADRLDPPFVGILSNGTSGDVNNINFREKSPSLPPFAKMRAVADEVAEAVVQANKDVELHDWVPLGAAHRELVLKVRKPTEEQLTYVRQVLAKPEDAKPYHSLERHYARRALQLHESPDEVSIPLQAYRIGDLGIAAIPFEVFTESGLAIKEKSPLQPAFTIELANGSYGYLPTPRQHELGGYETWLGTNRVQKDASEKIVATILDLLGDLKTEP